MRERQVLSRKMDKTLEYTFHTEDVQMANKYIKRQLTLLVLREMEFKTTVSIFTYSPEWLKLKTQTMLSISKTMERLKSQLLLMGI